jgi:hypothetical protein
VFRWSWMWKRLAGWFDVDAEELHGEGVPLETQLRGAAEAWQTLAAKHDLAEPDLNVLSSAWHTDADLGRPIEVVTDMSKSRRMGFMEYQATDEAFFDLFAKLRAARLIP